MHVVKDLMRCRASADQHAARRVDTRRMAVSCLRLLAVCGKEACREVAEAHRAELTRRPRILYSSEDDRDRTDCDSRVIVPLEQCKRQASRLDSLCEVVVGLIRDRRRFDPIGRLAAEASWAACR